MKSCLRALFAAMLLFSFMSVSCAQGKDKLSGAFAPDFKLQDLGQREYTLSSYQNKRAVLLFFWTTWCPYCRRALKEMNDRYPEFIKNDLEILTINVGEPKEKVKDFAKKNYLTFSLLLDIDTAVSQDFEILGVPTYVIVNKQGIIVYWDNAFPENYKNLI